MNDDIVTRLRVLLSKCCIAPAMAVWSRELRDAADEIELLREQLRLANIDNFNTTAEVDTLRAERDEARESYCLLMEAYRGGDGKVTANKLGWGYLFAEDSK